MMDATLGALIGGGLSMWGQDRANKATERLARDRMAWEERMSSTAHQREVRDLRAAGLNPILSAGGGASTPSGANPVISSISEGAATAARQLPHMIALTRKLNAEGDIARENAKIAKAEAFSAVQRQRSEEEITKKFPGMIGSWDALNRRFGTLGATAMSIMNNRGKLKSWLQEPKQFYPRFKKVED